MDDLISRQAAIDAAISADMKNHSGILSEKRARVIDRHISAVPSAQQQYEPVTAEDFAKTMSENTLYGYMAWHGEAITLMNEMGFVICKKTI